MSQFRNTVFDMSNPNIFVPDRSNKNFGKKRGERYKKRKREKVRKADKFWR